MTVWPVGARGQRVGLRLRCAKSASTAVTWLAVGALAGLSTLISGYRLDDLLIYLPMTVFLRDPTLYPGSPLIQHLLSMPYPLYRAFAVVYSPVSLLGVFVASRCALIASLWLLGRQLGASPGATILGIALLILTPGWFGTLGGTSLLQSEPSQFDVAVPFCIFALAASLGRRYLLALVIASIGFNLQPILGLIVMSVIGSDLLLNGVYRARTVSLRAALGTLCLGAWLASPEVGWTLAGLGTRLTEQSSDYVQIARFTAFYQIFPTTFSSQEWISSICMLIAVAFAIHLGAAKGFEATVSTWFAVVMILCLIGTIFSEVFPIGLVLKLMPFRSTLFLKVVSLLLIAKVIWQVLLRHHGRIQLLAACMTAGLTVTLLARPIHIPGVSTPSDLELAAAWARANTPVDALFATPPDPSVAGFMLFAERSTLGDYKLDTQAVWDPRFAEQAVQRLEALGCRGPWNPWCQNTTYASFEGGDFQRLRENFGACFALTRATQLVDMPLIYENASYRIYALCAGSV